MFNVDFHGFSIVLRSTVWYNFYFYVHACRMGTQHVHNPAFSARKVLHLPCTSKVIFLHAKKSIKHNTLPISEQPTPIWHLCHWFMCYSCPVRQQVLNLNNCNTTDQLIGTVMFFIVSTVQTLTACTLYNARQTQLQQGAPPPSQGAKAREKPSSCTPCVLLTTLSLTHI